MIKIITISREFGSGGRTIGKEVARELGIPCYDKELIEKIASMRQSQMGSHTRLSAGDGMVYRMQTGYGLRKRRSSGKLLIKAPVS